jgi:hypothetical protein
MDASLTETERRAYVAWLHSPSVYSEVEEETILAFKISRQLGTIPSRTLRVLRGVPGQDEALVRKIQAFVESEPTLTFVPYEDRRRVTVAHPLGD